jgi:hypothetical protein
MRDDATAKPSSGAAAIPHADSHRRGWRPQDQACALSSGPRADRPGSPPESYVLVVREYSIRTDARRTIGCGLRGESVIVLDATRNRQGDTGAGSRSFRGARARMAACFRPGSPAEPGPPQPLDRASPRG